MKPAAEAELDEADEALREHEYHRLLAATAAAQERLAQARPGGRELRWSDVFRPLVGEFKVDSATTLNYRPQ